jgi:hypothetical protein
MVTVKRWPVAAGIWNDAASPARSASPSAANSVRALMAAVSPLALGTMTFGVDG